VATWHEDFKKRERVNSEGVGCSGDGRMMVIECRDNQS